MGLCAPSDFYNLFKLCSAFQGLFQCVSCTWLHQLVGQKTLQVPLNFFRALSLIFISGEYYKASLPSFITLEDCKCQLRSICQMLSTPFLTFSLANSNLFTTMLNFLCFNLGTNLSFLSINLFCQYGPTMHRSF